ncbi:MAG: serine--tRNA ligase [Cyclobacteriaceae bacterium]
MLQVHILREEKQRVIHGLEKRGIRNAEELIATVIQHDDARKDTQRKLDDLKAKSNTASRAIGELMKAGKAAEANALREEVARSKDEVKSLEEQMARSSEAMTKALYAIPNVPHQKVPAGGGAKDNIVVHEHGTIPTLPSDSLPHWELIKKFDIIDFELGTKISGAGFPVYKGKGAKIQRALINFFLDQAAQAGYREIQPPIVINEASGYGTGQLPDKEGQMYHITADNLFLIPTAEVPVTNLYRDMILTDKELPIKNAGYTPCFRREAGSWGAHVRGLNRLHQFDKVEIVQIRKPAESYATLEEMCTYVQGLLEKLELPYRKLLLCGGDMGFNSAMTYDMEVFSAAQNMWLEVSSVSNFETYQANRLKLRHKNAEGKIELLHTLNGSALALPRILASILENNQSNDHIKVPAVLIPYTGFDRID